MHLHCEEMLKLQTDELEGPVYMAFAQPQIFIILSCIQLLMQPLSITTYIYFRDTKYLMINPFTSIV